MNAAQHDEKDPFNTLRPKVHRLSGWRRLFCRILSFFLRTYLASLRFRIKDSDRALLEQTPSPRLLVVWHNRSLIAPEMFRKFFNPRKIACLISPSKLAAWEVAFFDDFGLHAVRGSSSRRSIQAVREMLRQLQAGNDVGISPDGPSGPLYHFREGAVAIARRTGVPVLMSIPNARMAFRLPTWDRHLLPLPFARVEVALRRLEPGAPVWDGSDREVADHLRALCLEITEDPPHIHPDAAKGTR